jgi:hypothetical protein
MLSKIKTFVVGCNGMSCINKKMMKKLIFLFILFVNSFCFSQIINIPDADFKSLLLQANTDNNIAGGIKVDTNNNGEIEQSEALTVYSLDFPPGAITNLIGIEYFTNLFYLTCTGNNILSANLSTLVNMEILFIANNQLTSLNITGLTNLFFLQCGGNQLSDLNFSTLSALRIVQCGQNPFIVLDFSNNPLFEELSCALCPNLTTIKIKNNRQQILTQTAYNGCWNNNPNLNTICADANEVNALQSFLATCNITQPIYIVTDCSLNNENFADNNFSLSPNPTSENVYFDNSKTNYTTASIYNYLGQEILVKNLKSIFNENINVSTFEKGIYIIKFSNERESVSLRIIKAAK